LGTFFPLQLLGLLHGEDVVLCVWLDMIDSHLFMSKSVCMYVCMYGRVESRVGRVRGRGGEEWQRG
jgi:hypothetical protein